CDAGPVADEDVDVVRRVFEAFARRDAAAVAACFHEDGVFEPVTAQLVAGGVPYAGHAGIRRYMEDITLVWEDLRPEPSVFHDVGDGVVVAIGRVYAWGVGRVIDSPAGWLFRIHDGLVTYARVYDSTRQALEDGGLAER